LSLSADTLRRLALAALAPGSLLRTPPDWEGNVPPWTIPGLSGVARPLPWDAFASAAAPGLAGDEVQFVVDGEGAIVDRHGLDPALLDPIAHALIDQLGPPFVAIAVRDEGDVWAAASNEAEIVRLPDAHGDEVEVTRMDGNVTVRVDGEDSGVRFPALEELLDGDATAIAHRFTGAVFVVELFPL
jgi:hypothetical protein